MNNRFDVIVNDAETYEQAFDLPEHPDTRDAFAAQLNGLLAGGESGNAEEVHFKSVPQSEKRSDNFQNIMNQEGAIIDYLAAHDRPAKIRVICSTEDMATLYQVVYNFYYATEKGDRLGLEKWD